MYVFLFFISVVIPCTHPCTESEIKTNIVGGEDAEIEDFPFMVRLHIITGLLSASGCGGTYIKPLWVLTAAHCLDISEPGTTPAVGKHDRVILLMELERENQSHFQRTTSVKLILHPKYSIAGPVNDIALIKIKDPFKITQKAKLAALPDEFMVSTGSSAIAIGWGATNMSHVRENATMADRLQKLSTSVLDLKECRSQANSESVICIGKVGKVPCFGDSGGPLIYTNVVIGVASFIYPGNCSAFVGVYEDIHSHISWIKNEINASNIRIFTKILLFHSIFTIFSIIKTSVH